MGTERPYRVPEIELGQLHARRVLTHCAISLTFSSLFFMFFNTSDPQSSFLGQYFRKREIYNRASKMPYLSTLFFVMMMMMMLNLQFLAQLSSCLVMTAWWVFSIS